MRQHKFPAAQSPKEFRLTDFLGVDLTNYKSGVDTRRSPDAINLFMNQGGNLEKRKGLKKYSQYSSESLDIDENVDNIVSIHVPTYDGTTFKDILLVQIGTTLAYSDNDGAVWKEITGLATTNRLKFIQMPLQQNKFIITGYESFNLYVLVVDYYSVPPVFIEDWSDTALPAYESMIHIPTTFIACNPAGTSRTVYEQANSLSCRTINLFTGDGTSNKFYVDPALFGTLTSANTKVWVKTAGVWTLKTITTHYTLGVGYVQFTAGNIPANGNGVDNVKIQFPTKPDFTPVSTATAHGFYGFNGMRNYLFLGGSSYPEMEKMEYFMDLQYKVDEEYVGLYLGENNFTQFQSKITNYSLFSDKLAIFCAKNPPNPTVFLRSATLDSENEVIFPMQSGNSGVGVLVPATMDLLRSEPVWVSEYGVTAMTNTSVGVVDFAVDRGYYINQTILKYANLSDAIAFVYDNKYFLCIGADIYVADPRYKATQKDSYSGSPQYEWFKWVFMFNSFTINAVCIHKNDIIMATTVGMMTFKEETDTRPYMDRIGRFIDDAYYAAMYNAGTTYNIGSICYLTPGDPTSYYECKANGTIGIAPPNTTKWDPYVPKAPTTYSGAAYYTQGARVGYLNKYYVCIRSAHGVAPDAVDGLTYWVECVFYPGMVDILNLVDGHIEKTVLVSLIECPIVAYWNTPLMNMGNTTVRKSLSNLWVRLAKYDQTSVRVYYSTQGLVKDKSTFDPDDQQYVVPTNRNERKYMDIQFTIESNDASQFGLIEIFGKYVESNAYKG